MIVSPLLVEHVMALLLMVRFSTFAIALRLSSHTFQDFVSAARELKLA
jgi:hypothetical protein